MVTLYSFLLHPVLAKEAELAKDLDVQICSPNMYCIRIDVNYKFTLQSHNTLALH